MGLLLYKKTGLATRVLFENTRYFNIEEYKLTRKKKNKNSSVDKASADTN